MKTVRIILAACTVLVLLAEGMALAGSMEESMPGPDAEALWTYITKESPYAQWGYWPDHQGMQEGQAPHGSKHKVFVNTVGLESTTLPVAYGTIEVKENYSSDDKLTAITVMYKVKDYNPEYGDWYWAKYTPDGKSGPAGKPSGCITCHGTQAVNDFILVHKF